MQITKTLITMQDTVYQVIVGGIIDFESLEYQEAKSWMKYLRTMGYEYKLTSRGRDESEY
jgi:predicted mannosyl-3-phosphoglycerate phosphatase (HAD superfamily)